MAKVKLLDSLTKFLVVSTALVMLAPTASAKPRFKVLARVSGGLYGGLTFNEHGNLYGVTNGGGDYAQGSIFELTHKANGNWTATTLHSFDLTDGSEPNGNLVFDPAGNLYGTAPVGGSYDSGTVFELIPGSHGRDFSVLYEFCQQTGCPDGDTPAAGVVLDGSGSLYGTTVSGGTYGGIVFELTPGSTSWDESILYNFGFRSHDGDDPLDALAFGSTANLFGTTFRGGAYGGGTVFRLSRRKMDKWKEQILYSFCPGGFPCVDGVGPYAGVIFDRSGNIYGTTTQGGHSNCGETHCGTVFKLTPGRNGHWKEAVLYEFPDPQNGSFPTGGVIRDKAGNLYGATVAGGIGPCTGGCGVAYKLEPRAHGKWKYSVLHKFTQGDGWQPLGGLIFDGKGNLYGTAYSTVFEITP